MVVQRKFSGIAERIGNGTADFVDKLSESVREFSCQLWSKYPDFITENKAIGTSFARGFMTNLCKDKTLPLAPQPPFEGGQCFTRYDVTAICKVAVKNTFQGVNQGDIIRARTNNARHNGPIKQLVPTPFKVNEHIYIHAKPDSRNIPYPYYYQGGQIFWGNPSNDNLPIAGVYVSEIIGYELVREDGQADNCGDLPIQYPTTNHTQQDFQTIININIEDGDTLTFPLVYVPIDFNFPLNFDLGGLNVTVDLGGINFDFNLIGIDGLPISLPTGENPPIIPEKPPIDTTPKNKTRCYLPLPPNSNDLDKTVSDDVEEEEEETEPGKIVWILVTIINPPDGSNFKTITQDNPEDNTYFAGYFCWTIVAEGETYRLPEEPIRKLKNAYFAPENTNGYRIYAINGARLKVTKFEQKEEV